MQNGLTILAAMVSIAVSDAKAYQFSPVATRISMDGGFTVIIDGTQTRCNIKAVVKSNADGSGAKMVSFTNTSPNCSALNAGALPWKIKPRSADTAVIVGFTYNSITQVCGPIDLKATVNTIGQWSVHKKYISGGSLCFIDGAWSSTPPIVIQ